MYYVYVYVERVKEEERTLCNYLQFGEPKVVGSMVIYDFWQIEIANKYSKTCIRYYETHMHIHTHTHFMMCVAEKLVNVSDVVFENKEKQHQGDQGGVLR